MIPILRFRAESSVVYSFIRDHLTDKSSDSSSTQKAPSEANLLANHTLLEVRLHFPVSYGIGHEYDTLTKWFRKICDEAEMVAGPYAIDRLIEDTFTCCNI